MVRVLHSEDVLPVRYELNLYNYVEESRPLLWSSGQSSRLQNEGRLSFLWSTNWIYVCYIKESRPPLWSSGHSSWLQNGGRLCFLWGKSWIYESYVEESRPPLWSSGQSSWLHNGNVLWFLHATEFFYVEESRPPMWSSGKSSWLQNIGSHTDYTELYPIRWQHKAFKFAATTTSLVT
jgi:hypothetical protein